MVFSTVALQNLGFGSSDDLGTVLGADGCQSQYLSCGQKTLVCNRAARLRSHLPGVSDVADAGAGNVEVDVYKRQVQGSILIAVSGI